MKKYILAAALALCAIVGPSVGSANAQGWFSRNGGPTFVDRLVGNGYGYNNYGAYNGYNNYNFNRCNNGGWGNGWNNGWGNNNNWRHHHHHHHRRFW